MFLSPKIDIVFKAIFGTEKNIDLLESFLSSVLNEKVSNIVLTNIKSNSDYIVDEFSRLNVNAIINNQCVNIEIQIKNEDSIMDNKYLYYWSKLYSDQLGQLKSNFELKKYICINILDFNYTNEKNFHSKYIIMNEETKNTLLDDLEIHFIELKKVPSKNITDSLTAWVTFLNNPLNDELLKFNEIQKAKNELININFNENQRLLYEQRIKLLRDRISSLYGIIIKLIENGMDLNDISNATNVPIYKLIELQDKI